MLFRSLVTANSLSDDVSVLLGNGDGTFQPEMRLAVSQLGERRMTMSVAMADLNADGKLDIIAAGRASNNLKIYFNE